MSTREISIKGVLLTVGQPFAEGHVCTAAEAKALNQTRAENISNALRSKITEKASEDGTYTDEALAAIGTMAAEYDAAYEFTLTSTGGGRKAVDPLEKECIAIARAAVTAELKKKGIKLKDLPEGKMDEFIEQYKDNDKIVALAKKRLKEREQLASAVEVSLD